MHRPSALGHLNPFRKATQVLQSPFSPDECRARLALRTEDWDAKERMRRNPRRPSTYLEGRAWPGGQFAVRRMDLDRGMYVSAAEAWGTLQATSGGTRVTFCFHRSLATQVVLAVYFTVWAGFLLWFVVVLAAQAVTARTLPSLAWLVVPVVLLGGGAALSAYLHKSACDARREVAAFLRSTLDAVDVADLAAQRQ